MIVAGLENIIKKNGFSHFGFTPLKRPLSIEHYKRWLTEGKHGDMAYMATHLPIKENPQTQYPEVRSSIVVAENYVPHPKPRPNSPLRIALYARGEDYHLWLQNKLKKLAQEFKVHFGSEKFLCFTDSAPVLERELAYLSGLGWIGKNTCVIHPQNGSLWFIGEIFTSLELPNHHPPIKDFCGTCSRCIDSCPTGAIEAPKKLDATKCISYLTIEAKNDPPEHIRPKIGSWFFGCDICQTVCPWNEKVFGREFMQELTEEKPVDREALTRELTFILETSNKKLMQHFADSPLSRARGRGLKRNAIIVAANLKLRELQSPIQKIALTEASLSSLAHWALAQL